MGEARHLRPGIWSKAVAVEGEGGDTLCHTPKSFRDSSVTRKEEGAR